MIDKYETTTNNMMNDTFSVTGQSVDTTAMMTPFGGIRKEIPNGISTADSSSKKKKKNSGFFSRIFCCNTANAASSMKERKEVRKNIVMKTNKK